MAIISRSGSPLTDEDVRAAQGTRGTGTGHQKRARTRTVEICVLLLAALLGAFGTKTFIAQVFSVPSASMDNTVAPGERLAIEKVGYVFAAPRPGDVVVFDGEGLFADPQPGQHVFVKRVIGVGGDRVICCDASSRITVNGIALEETEYIFPGDQPSATPFDVQVPAGTLWLMGDHRSASADSRAYLGTSFGGFVPMDRVIGRAVAVVWPASSARTIGLPATFGQTGLR